MPHPATMFFLLTLVVIFCSWIADIYGFNVIHPQTGEVIRVQSLLNSEGIRWLLKNVITNFTGFSPLGMVMITMFGVGVAQHSGFITACIRRGLKTKPKRGGIIWLVIILGILSNAVGDAGYIILLPIAATLFHSVGLHPIAGIITAFVSVGCGYSANIMLSTLDPMIAQTTQEATVLTGSYSTNTGPLSNYYFMFASVVFIAGIIYLVTRNKLLPVLGNYEGGVRFAEYKPLSRRERRGLTLALIVGLIYAILVYWATFSSWGLLRGVNGGLVRSPFITGILFILSLGFGIMGTVYGFSSGRYRTDGDVIEGLTQPMKLLATYFVIAFFAAQMFACFDYSQLNKCIAIMGADLLSSVELSRLGTLVLFIWFTALVNLIMVSATGKWSFMAFIFVPVFARMGISPDMTQCAFRIGDSATNVITPFLFYIPLVLTYMQQYDKQTTFGSLFRYTWRYSLHILVFWTILFIGWYLSGLPFGM